MNNRPVIAAGSGLRRCSLAAVTSCACLAVLGCSWPAAAPEQKPAAAVDQGLKDDLARVKDTQPSQSHTMMDVGFHMANMWFAGQAKNWPLARFYFNETRQHIRWTIRVRPVRKDLAGQPVDLKAIFDAIDSSTFETLKASIEEKNAATFQSAYKQTLESCYSCHKACGLDFLRPMVPAAGPQPIINLDPTARWPE
jgi:hypothetical protein